MARSFFREGFILRMLCLAKAKLFAFWRKKAVAPEEASRTAFMK